MIVRKIQNTNIQFYLSLYSKIVGLQVIIAYITNISGA